MSDAAPPPASPASSDRARQALLGLAVVACLVPDPRAATLTFLIGPPIALALGAALGLGLGNPWSKRTGAWSKRLLQVAVIGLGFGLQAREVVTHALYAVPVTLVGIALTFALGAALARLLRADGPTSFLVTTGTAICGGSAIAAMAPVVQADDEQTGVSLATIFTLNAVALLLFPPLGRLLDLPQGDFGAWAALAIHDTSSVVGACSAYGEQALAVGTTTKLARALWILPLVLVVAWRRRSDERAPFPLFLVGFAVAVALRAYVPAPDAAWKIINTVARQVLVVTVLLIGVGLTRDVLRKLGARPLAQGVLLWVLVGAGSLGAVMAGWVPIGD